MPWENTRVAQCALAHAKGRLEPREPEGLGEIVPRLKKHHGLYGKLEFLDPDCEKESLFTIKISSSWASPLESVGC